MTTPIVRTPPGTGQRLKARVLLGTADIGPGDTLGYERRRVELKWLSAGETDTVNVDLCGYQPSRVGVVVGLDGAAPRLVPQPTYMHWIDRDTNEADIVAAAVAAYADRPQA